jgi:hypothetical protein
MTIAHAVASIRFATGCSNGGYESETKLSFVSLTTALRQRTLAVALMWFIGETLGSSVHATATAAAPAA